MKKEEYERQYDELYRKLEDVREQQWVFRQLQQRVYEEEDQNDAEIRYFQRVNMELEEDWCSRNMVGNHAYLFDDDIRIQNNMNVDRMYLWNEDEEMNRHLRKLRYEEEGYEEEMSRLSRIYEDTKEEEHGQDD